MNTRAIGLEALGLTGEDWGPCYAEQFTHAEFSAAWRGAVPCPSEAAITAAAAPIIANDAIKSEILAIEATMTKRRIREAVLGTDGGWLAAREADIVALRAQLTP